MHCRCRNSALQAKPSRLRCQAARAFAERILREGGKDEASRIQFAYRQALNRPAQPAEVKVLTDLHGQHLRQSSPPGLS